MSMPCKMHLEDLNSGRLGYHCQLCDKHITDFRDKTTAEIVRVIQESPNKVCGIFSKGQTDYKTSHISLPRLSQRVGLSLMGILGFMGPVLTGCEKDTPEQSAVKLDAFRKLKFPMDLNGMLRDHTTGKPIPHARVSLQQNGKTILETVTDDKGYFTFFVQRKDLRKETFDLAFQADGYFPDTLQDFFHLSEKENRVRLSVSASPALCEKIMVIENTIEVGDVVVSGIEAPEVLPAPEPPLILGEPTIEIIRQNGTKDHTAVTEKASEKNEKRLFGRKKRSGH